MPPRVSDISRSIESVTDSLKIVGKTPGHVGDTFRNVGSFGDSVVSVGETPGSVDAVGDTSEGVGGNSSAIANTVTGDTNDAVADTSTPMEMSLELPLLSPSPPSPLLSMISVTDSSSR